MGQNFKDLIAWQKAMDLVMEIYAATENFPREEIYGLTSQLRRAAVSIPSNIAEGQARFSKKDFRLSYALPKVRWRKFKLRLQSRQGSVSSPPSESWNSRNACTSSRAS